MYLDKHLLLKLLVVLNLVNGNPVDISGTLSSVTYSDPSVRILLVALDSVEYVDRTVFDS